MGIISYIPRKYLVKGLSIIQKVSLDLSVFLLEKAYGLSFDLALAKYLKKRGRAQGVVFLQVGAFDGRVGDPIYEYIVCHNWVGVLIEPQSYYFERLKEAYSGKDGLQFVKAAIAHERGQKPLYTIDQGGDASYEDAAVASFNRNILLDQKGSIENIEEKINEEIVDTLPLMEVIYEKNIINVELIQIDTEGFDNEIVKMIDFEEVNPAIIQFEHMHLSNDEHKEVINYLKKNGYKVGKNGNDTFAFKIDI